MEKKEANQRKIIFFDGVCHLCNTFVDHVLLQDRFHKFYFASLQGFTSEQLLSFENRSKLDTIIYFDCGKIYYRSSAIIKIFIELGRPYSFLAILIVVPGPVRDIVYKVIAKNRYSWFGKKDACRIPTTNDKEYLLP